jgi:LuxR family transcriptional regulator, quorum-sensing system regulator BjaR1
VSELGLREHFADEALERHATLVVAARMGSRIGPLTRRQYQALEAMSRGLSYGEAAVELALGVETVKEHLKRVRKVLGARNTNHAISEAFRRGLLS